VATTAMVAISLPSSETFQVILKAHLYAS